MVIIDGYFVVTVSDMSLIDLKNRLCILVHRTTRVANIDYSGCPDNSVSPRVVCSLNWLDARLAVPADFDGPTNSSSPY